MPKHESTIGRSNSCYMIKRLNFMMTADPPRVGKWSECLSVLRNNYVGVNIIHPVVLWTLGHLDFVSLEEFINNGSLFLG